MICGEPLMLVVELERGADPEVAICFDREGLELLISRLSRLREVVDHDHMKTSAWGGHELPGAPAGGERYTLVNHLRLVRLPDISS